MGCGCNKSAVQWQALRPGGTPIGTYPSVVLAQKALNDAGVPKGQGAVKPVSGK